MSKATKRTDPHRIGAIVPEDYTYVRSYNMATTCDGWPVPSYGINCELDRRILDKEGRIVQNGEHDADGLCCIVGMLNIARVRFATHGTTGKCTVCGACFVDGDVWRHDSTGEHIHVGHICAEKYNLLAERGDFDAKVESHRARTAALRIAEENRTERAAFLDAHPGLEAALATDHSIVQDIAAKFRSYRSLSEKQIALVFKLAAEAANPKPAEQHVPAPEGRVTVRGRVVSTKSDETAWGLTIKMTVLVETPEGTWLAWGTAPDSILGEPLRGCEVEFTATLARGRDPHFALYKRPTKARIVSRPVAAEQPAA